MKKFLNEISGGKLFPSVSALAGASTEAQPAKVKPPKKEKRLSPTTFEVDPAALADALNKDPQQGSPVTATVTSVDGKELALTITFRSVSDTFTNFRGRVTIGAYEYPFNGQRKGPKCTIATTETIF